MSQTILNGAQLYFNEFFPNEHQWWDTSKIAVVGAATIVYYGFKHAMS